MVEMSYDELSMDSWLDASIDQISWKPHSLIYLGLKRSAWGQEEDSFLSKRCQIVNYKHQGSRMTLTQI
jgi:hypothetical protein